MKTRALHRSRRGTQRGIGTVVIVMVLFFVVSLAAAYASRNMIFEQKTSSNQTRSTVAFEAAEAGVEWTLAQLNGGKIDTDCVNASPTTSFQNRYLAIDANGIISAATTGRGTGTDPKLWPTCVHNGVDGWNCSCPTTANGTLSIPGGVPPPLPAFRVWPATPEPSTVSSSPWTAWSAPIPGLMPINVVGCTALAVDSGDTCLDYYGRANLGEASAGQRVWLALRSGLAVPPSAAVTARIAVTPSSTAAAAGVKLIVTNEDAASGGFTVNTGGAATRSAFDARSVPGTPGSASFADSDSRLVEVSTVSTATGALTGGDRMFALIFGAGRSTYKDQPGLRHCTSPCAAANVNALMASDPNRPIWVDGNLTVDADIGDATTPALLIVDGDTLTMSSGRTIYGFVYLTGGSTSTDATINLPAGASYIRGAVVAERGLLTSYASTPASGQELTITYDRAAMDKLRTSYGSWVRAPGGWSDFKAVP